MLDVEASSGRMKFINNCLTRMCLNDTILQNYNYYCRGLCQDGRGNVTQHTEGVPPPPDQGKEILQLNKEGKFKLIITAVVVSVVCF